MLLLVYVLLIAVASLSGGWLPNVIRLTHIRMQLMLSAVSGLMLGVAAFVLWPHAAMAIPLDQVALWLVAGLLVMFFMQRVFSFHTHEVYDDVEVEAQQIFSESHGEAAAGEQTAPAAKACEHDHDHDHHHDHAHHHHDHGHGHHHDHGQLSWGGVAFGLGLHTIIDGVALAGSYSVESQHAGSLGLAGLGTFLVVMLHKPFDALSITALMAKGGWSPAARHLMNGLFALMIPVGIGLFYLGVQSSQIEHEAFVGCVLAFAAGCFLCIALSDLLPEIQFHHHHRLPLSVSLVLGVVLAYGIAYLESSVHGHDHSHAHTHSHARE